MCTLYFVTSLGDKDGHILVTQKTLESFQTFGLRWLGHSFGFLRENDPTPYGPKRDDVSHVYIAVHLDDMAIAMLRPKEFLQLIIDKYKLKLNSTVTVSLELVHGPVSDDVTQVHYVDAPMSDKSLVHGYVTGILQFVNAIPIKWFSKCPSYVEMVTHESEFPIPGDTNDVGIY